MLVQLSIYNIYLLDHPHCIEVTPHANKGNAISILKNDQVIDTTPSLNNFNEAHQLVLIYFFQVMI